LQPAPQWSSEEPQYPQAEQHSDFTPSRVLNPTHVYPLSPPQEPSRDFSPEVVGVAEGAEETWLALELASIVVLASDEAGAEELKTVEEETVSLLTSAEEDGAGVELAATEEEALLTS
jgi:hypothetical protein